MRVVQKMFVEKLYLLSVVCGFILWILFDKLSHFCGASSMIYAFLFAINSEKRIIVLLILCWIPVFLVCLVMTCLYAHKRHNHIPFFVIVTIEFLVSAIFIMVKIISKNYVSLDYMIGGELLRILLFYGIFWYYQKSHKKGESIEKNS